MLLSEATMTDGLTLAPTGVVVLTKPEPVVLRLIVVALAPESAKVSCCPAVGKIVILPPVVEMVACEPDGPEMVRPFAPPPELSVMRDAPDADIADKAPRVSCGVLI